MKVLVTGGLGFIGSHIVKAIEKSGHEVLIVDKRRVTEVTPNDINHIAHRHISDVDCIVHAAAHADIHNNWGENTSDRGTIFHNNILGTFNLLEQSPTVPFIFLSTCAVYGSDVLWADETYQLRPESPYAASKVAGEAMVEAWAYKRKNPHYILRLVSNVGEGCAHGHVPDFVHMAQKLGYITAKDSGYFAKSYIHVEDTTDFVLSCVDGWTDPGTYNVSSLETWSWRDTAELMGVGTNSPDNRAGSVGDPVGLTVSIRRAVDQGWQPERKLKQGVLEALEWNGWKL